MKKYLTLAFLLFFGSFSFAQNYNCLQYGPINYFRNGNGYIRAIRIDSIRARGSDTIFHPYHTPRGTYFSCWTNSFMSLDSNGASWLGKNVIKQADGTFLFDNIWNDTVIIRTQANLGETWSFFNDTTYESYKATVASVDTMTILGALDSIKKITIEADSAGVVNPLDSVNGFQIILSKNNGFVQVFDLYTFPYHRPDTIYQYREFFDWDLDVVLGNLGIGDMTCFWGNPNSPDTINSVFHRFAYHNPTQMQIYDFAIGDVYDYNDYEYGTYGYTSIYILDSVISKVVTPYYVQYQMSEYTNTEYFNGTTATYTASHNNVVVIADTSRLFNFNLLPEETGSSGFYYYFPDSMVLAADSGFSPCTADIYLEGTVQLQYNGTATFPGYLTRSYGIDYGQTEIFTQNYTSYDFRTKSYVSAIKGGNICGNYARFNAGIINVNPSNNDINIFPNPAHDKLNITSTGGIREVTIGNLLGQVLFSSTYDQDKLEIDISGLPAGVYYVKINGYETRKFVKE